MSRAWKDFTKISQNEAKCVHCGVVIAMRKSSTAKLLAHIAKHHSKASPVADGGVNTLQSPLPKDNILAYLRSCRDNLLDTDVTIYCNDGTVTAHKLVLGSISQMLFVEFSINFQDESVSLILPDCSSQLITQYLDAIYSCSSVKSFDSLNEMFGYEMAVRFLPNLLNYNEAKLQEDVTEKENLNDSMKDEMNEEDDQENNGVTEHRKPVIIPFYKKPANDGVNKVISFVKKSQSSPGKTHRKSSKVWFHYHEDPTDSRNRICRHCGFVIFCPDKSTWTMHSHIISKHKEKIFSFSEGIILQNFEDEEIKKSKPPLKVEKTSEVMDDSHIDPETGEIVSKLTKKRKKKRSQVWKYFVEDTQEPGLEGKRGAICQICLAVVHCNDSSTSNMLNHLNSVHDVTINHKKESSESSMCSICGQIFNSKASRDRHENLHLEQFKFYCNFCGKGFMEASRKVKHERTHTGEKPHQCSECGRRFAEKGQLTAHFRNHTGETPYQCDKCFTKFKFLSSKNKHKCVPMNSNI